eukprot:CAMPEP_0170246030 /NCGR_PEP_ID=MMETSP0116_2-20130129/22802_1 /TAXON_ID=400756 /ORGANISM="Durinskia baltica, Strain CSIRO CS-38" /LENGTH=190 /DNA_ID=CAMNT_0010496907 /DNA_START=70 /DNA_END=642 /DNA_ORIENTATION=-
MTARAPNKLRRGTAGERRRLRRSCGGEHMPSVLPVGLARPQNRAGEMLVVDAVRPELWLQTDGAETLPTSTLPMPPSLRVVGLADDVPGVDLQTGLVCPDIHGDAVWADETRRQHVRVTALGPVQAIVHIDGPTPVDGLLQQVWLCPEVQVGALHGRELATDDQLGVHRCGPGPNHHQTVVQYVPRLMPL